MYQGLCDQCRLIVFYFDCCQDLPYGYIDMPTHKNIIDSITARIELEDDKAFIQYKNKQKFR